MYLDDGLVDTEHLCCLVHARVKFKYASEQSGDKDADFFLVALENFLSCKPNMKRVS